MTDPLPRDPAPRIPPGPAVDPSALLLRVRADAAAERSLRESLGTRGSRGARGALPLDAVLAAHPDLRTEPLFGGAPEGARAARGPEWVMPSDRWSRTPAGDAVNILWVPPGAEPEALRRQIADDPRIDYVEHPPVRYPAAVDPLAEKQWGLAAARFPAVWAKLEGPAADPIAVAVLDSGCARHPDLPPLVKYETYGSDPADEDDHGTGVCGVLAARRGNGLGVAGAAICALHVYKILDRGWSWRAYLQALRDVERSGVRVLNLSLTGPAENRTERTLIRECVRAGITVVAAMGNEGSGSPPLFPAAYFPEVIAVGATGRRNGRDHLAEFSSWGDHVWIVAPGEEVATTSVGATGYRLKEGTSFAAPLVSAACVQLLRWRPDLNPEGIRKWIANLTVPLPGQKGWHRGAGFGRLDLSKLT